MRLLHGSSFAKVLSVGYRLRMPGPFADAEADDTSARTAHAEAAHICFFVGNCE